MDRKFQFYIVPTPIGNMGDITLRALDVLKNVDIIACEDTRTTQNILNKYNIKTKTVSYHKYNEKKKSEELVNIIKSGKTIALVSDAGTPMVCDPGSVLLKTLHKNNISVTALSGACTLPTFLSQIPRDNEKFIFIGFLPKTNQRTEDLLIKYADENLVFFESPNRLKNTLESIKKTRGNVQVAIGRELTKLYEEVIVDSTENLINHFSNGIKGEIVCMVYPNDCSSDFDTNIKIKKLKDKGFKSKEIASILSVLYNLNKNDIYKMCTE